MKNYILLLVSLFIMPTANCQIMDSTIIKTRLFQDIVGFNPNIGFEKPFFKKLTGEVEYMYRNRYWYGDGGEWDFGTFRQSTGFKIKGGLRVYIGKNKPSLFAWFFGCHWAFSQIKFKNFVRYNFWGDYEETINLRIRYPEVMLSAGRQFLLGKRITIEFYFGPSVYLYYAKKKEILNSNDPNEIGNIISEYYPEGADGRFNVCWTIGYKL